MAFCYGYWTELSKAGIPEISPDIFAKIAFKLAMDVHEGVPVAPALATWVFIIACVNSVYPRAYSEIPRKVRENAENLARMLGVYVVFRTFWFAFMLLLNRVIRAYSPLSYAIWLWLSLVVVTLSVAAVITSAHYTHAFWTPGSEVHEPQDPPEPPSETGESRQPDDDYDPGDPAPSVARYRSFVPVDYQARRSRLGYPRPGSFNRALAYIPINPRGAEEESIADEVLEPPPEPPVQSVSSRNFLARVFERITRQAPPPPPPSPPPPPTPPMSPVDVVELPKHSKRTRRRSRY